MILTVLEDKAKMPKFSNSFQTRFLQVVTLTKCKLERAGKAHATMNLGEE